MAAAQASPRNSTCFHCKASLEGVLSRHVCAQCGYPQPVAAGEDYFGALGVPKRFAQDRAAIEKRFYEISRALHPDRFTTATPEARRHSLERMSFLNEAYRTLKSPEALREYYLERAGVAAGKSQTPLELAETWFELQEALVDDPAGAEGKISEFERTLAVAAEKSRAHVAKIENEIDQSSEAPRALFENLSREIQTQSYLKSMERDAQKLKQRLGSVA